MSLITACHASISSSTTVNKGSPAAKQSEESPTSTSGTKNNSSADGMPSELLFSESKDAESNAYSADGAVKISWQPPIGEEIASYSIQIYKSAACSGAATIIEGIQETSYQFSGESGTSYSLKIEAVRLSGSRTTSLCSGTITVDTSGPLFSGAPIASMAPQGLTSAITTTNEFYIRWLPATDSESGVKHYAIRTFETISCAGNSTDSAPTTEATMARTGVDGDIFSFQVIAFNQAGAKTVSLCSNSIKIDTNAPQIDQKGVTASDIQSGSVTLSWSAARDTAHTDLEYRLCTAAAGTSLSTVNEVLTQCDTSGWQSGWTKNALSSPANLNMPETSYAANVIVRDPAGFMSAYEPLTFTTGNDDTNPIPANNGLLTVTNLTDISADLSWTAASDNFLQSSLLEYRVCLAKTNSVSNVPDALANCRWQSRWSRNLASIMIDGLLGAKSYWLNVLVRDRRQNIAVYQSIQLTTQAPVAESFYVDDNFTITNDTGIAGLSTGDEITFAPGEHGERNGLVFGTNAFSTVASAYTAAATTGGRIVLGSGTFNLTAQLNLNADIALIGQGSDQSTVKINYNTAGAGDARGAILGQAGRKLIFSNFKLDGTGFNVYQALRSYADPVRITNCWFNQIRFSAYYGWGFVQIGISTAGAEIRNNHFSNIHRIGANYYANGGSVVYRWNKYVGKGAGDYLDFAFVTVGAMSATVSENQIDDIRGVASLDSAEGFAIWAYNIGMSQSHMLATRNEINNTGYAFGAGYVADPGIQVTITNNVMNNVTYGIYADTLQTVDVSHNWWGNATGPKLTLNPAGTGAEINDQQNVFTNITYAPWALSTWIE